MFAYVSGVFMKPVTLALHWTKVEYSSAFTVMMGTGLIVGPIAGRIIDRVGARRVALCGIFPFVMAFSALGLANGNIWQWWLLAMGMALTTGLVGTTVWITPVVRRFDKARGIALAFSLAGMGVASTLGPLLAATFITWVGWRLAFSGIAIVWAIPSTLLTWHWFFDQRAAADQTASGDGVPVGKVDLPVDSQKADLGAIFRSPQFLAIVAAGSLFSCLSYATAVHLVPMMEQNGLGLAKAASIAGTAGFFAIVGRISVGFALDRFATRSVSLVVFGSPILVALLLLNAHGALVASLFAAAVFGLVNGAETDVIAYLVAQRFSRASFASTYSVIGSVISTSASLGPLLAAVIADRFGSYTPFLILIIPVSFVTTTMIWFSTSSPIQGATPTARRRPAAEPAAVSP